MVYFVQITTEALSWLPRLLKEKKCLVVVVTPSSAPHVPYKQLSNLLRRSPYFGMHAVACMYVYI